jgi:hypothetical protein
MRNGSSPLSAALILAGFVALGAQPSAPDPRSLGPQVGARVPDFALHDQHGATRTLKSTFGPKGAVLVFFRSADW